MAFKTLVFATDRDQLRAWRSAAGARDAHAVVVTADLHVAAAIEDSGQPYLEVWSYLEAADIDRAQKLCQQLAAEWWRPFLGEIEHKGVHLADAMSRDMWYAFTTAIHANTVINRILDAEKPERLVLFSDLEKATFWDSVDGSYPDVFNAVALWTAEQRNLPVRKLSTELRLLPKKCNSVSHGQSVSQTKRHLSSRWSFDTPLSPARRTVLTFMGSVDRQRHHDLLHALGQSDDYHHVLLGGSPCEVLGTNSQVIDWQDCRAWFSPAPSLERQLREAWRRFKRWQVEYTGDFPAIFANPHLDFQFKGFWERVIMAAQIVDAATLVCSALQPDLCIFGLDAYGPGVCWNRVAKLCGVTTLTIPHGVIGLDSRYELLNSEADYLAVEGDYSRRALQALGRPPETIKVVGFPGEAPSSSHRGHRNKAVLLMTTQSGIANPTKLRNDWRRVSELIERRQDLHFVIKPHPRYDHYHFYRNLCAKLPSNIELREGVSLSEVFPDVSVAVMVNYPSTAALEAMLAGVPVVYLRSALYKTAGLRSALDSDDVICVDRVEDLEAVLDELLTNPAARVESQRRAQTFLADFLSPPPSGSWVDSLLELVERLVDRHEPSGPSDTATQEMEILLTIQALRNYIDSDEAGGLRGLLTPLVRRRLPGRQRGACISRSGTLWLARQYLSKARSAFHRQQLNQTTLCILRALLWNPGFVLREGLRFLARRLGCHT